MKKIYNYAINPDKLTLEQFKNCYSEKFVTAAALMPDAHSGYVAPIGSVLITKNFIVPAWVGYDIGCGLIAVRIKCPADLIEQVKKKAEEIHKQINRDIPMGKGHTNSSSQPLSKETQEKFSEIVKEFEKGEYDKNILNYIKNAARKHLGTLGGGNHFIELSVYKKELWLVIHSGSRGIGHRVAQKYMIKASGSKSDFEKTSPLEVNSQLGKEYLNILDFGLKYALLNRLEMSYRVIKAIEKVLKIKLSSSLWTNKTHNHALLEKSRYIHRKGATPAKKKERGVIPGNMRDGSYLVEGLGNSKFLYSSAHGAGRAMSRTQAKKDITLEQFKQEMKNITATISQKTLDEAPQAYKNLNEVMQAQKSSVKPLKLLKPILNWKG